MCPKESKNGYQYFAFEHNHQYQKIQFQFYDAVESLDPQQIGVSASVRFSKYRDRLCSAKKFQNWGQCPTTFEKWGHFEK